MVVVQPRPDKLALEPIETAIADIRRAEARSRAREAAVHKSAGV
jgi:hypothetical protein